MRNPCRPRRAGLALPLLLAACSASPIYRPAACEPDEAVSTVLGGYAAAGVSDEGVVTDSDLDMTIAIRPAGTTCR